MCIEYFILSDCNFIHGLLHTCLSFTLYNLKK